MLQQLLEQEGKSELLAPWRTHEAAVQAQRVPCSGELGECVTSAFHINQVLLCFVVGFHVLFCLFFLISVASVAGCLIELVSEQPQPTNNRCIYG